MHLHRFIGNFNFFNLQLKIFDKEIIKQIRNVLRLKRGDRFILCDGKLNEALVEIVEARKDYISTKIIEVWQNKNEPENYIILYSSLLKKENFELVVQKTTEVGVREIVPIITERTIKLSFKKERMKKIIKEAVEQSGRGIVPVLQDAVNFEKAIELARKNDLNLFFDANGVLICHPSRSLSVAKNLTSDFWGDSLLLVQNGSNTRRSARHRRIGVFIGPEGGWSKKEIESVRNIENFKIVSLGKLTFRAETAAIISIYLASCI